MGLTANRTQESQFSCKNCGELKDIVSFLLHLMLFFTYWQQSDELRLTWSPFLPTLKQVGQKLRTVTMCLLSFMFSCCKPLLKTRHRAARPFPLTNTCMKEVARCRVFVLNFLQLPCLVVSQFSITEAAVQSLLFGMHNAGPEFSVLQWEPPCKTELSRICIAWD